MRRVGVYLILSLLSAAICHYNVAEAKKIKQNLSIEKESKKNKSETKKIEQTIPGVEIFPTDSLEKFKALFGGDKAIGFAGYDKEANSSKESFLIVNPSEYTLTGFTVDINYLDMQGRMLHSRKLTEPCFVPPGETRRIDLRSWDSQKTYYYYLGNAPKKVATPYQVSITPLSFWIEDRAE